MKKKRSDYSKKVGMPPESLFYTGDRKPSPTEMEILVYDENTCKRIRTGDLHKLLKSLDKNMINFIIINNINDVTLIEDIGKHFSIHPLLLEDVLNTSHLPKVEESGDQLFLTLKLLAYSVETGLQQQHISLIMGDYYVIAFKDFENGLFEEIITRIESGKSKARHRGSDYLFYLLTDTLVDRYYSTVNEINNEIDEMEVKLLEEPDLNYIQNLYMIKKAMSDMRGILYPIREAILNVVQGDYSRIGDETITYLKDVRDHINHIIHMYENCRDTLSDLIELNGSNINNRLNRSMKILTIITTVFIPLTLITGIYGMNFDFMPELGWRLGYPIILGLMLVTALTMIFFIRRNKLL